MFVLQNMACLVLTYYVLMIENVKIILESQSPQMMREKSRKHKIYTIVTICLLLALLIMIGMFNYLDMAV